MNPLRSPLALLIVAVASSVCADDGWMPMNGSASSLNGKHPTVRMVSEIVRATVHKNFSTVTCDFVFKNDGPACTVRMGFPDAGEQDWENNVKDLDKTTLTHFQSSVDGKRIQTRHVIFGENDDFSGHFEVRQWEVKDVKFARGQTLKVRDSYQSPHGSSTLGDHHVQHFYYMLATGGTWKGTIGRADVIVTIAEDAVPGKIEIVKPRDDMADIQELVSFWNIHKSAVAWAGPCTPVVQGRILTFTKKDWSPKVGEDVILTFGIKRN